MKQHQEEPLIRGTFEPDRALEILSTLFTSKIQLHNVKTFNSFIRTGAESAEDNNRRMELKESLSRLKANLEALAEALAEADCLIQLDCMVKLTVVNRTSNNEPIQGPEAMRGHHAS